METDHALDFAGKIRTGRCRFHAKVFPAGALHPSNGGRRCRIAGRVGQANRSVRAPMSRCTGLSAAMALMLCCTAATLCSDAFAASPRLVAFEGAPRPLGSPEQRFAGERGELPKGISGD